MKTVGITFSAFDLFHAGHVEMLREARSQCDWLIVGLQTDPTIDRPEKNKPSQTIVERYLQVSACKWVDEIIPYSTEAELLDILQIKCPNMRFIGEEYVDKDFTGKEWCLANNVELRYGYRKHRFSTSALRVHIANEEMRKNS